jgi:hypothetical protein
MTLTKRALALLLVNFSMMAINSAAQSTDWGAKRAAFHQKFEAACGQDVSELCGSTSNHFAIHQCLNAKEKELSLSCSNLLTEFKAHRHQQ